MCVPVTYKLYTFLPFTIDTASQRELYSSTKTEAMKSLYRNCYSNNLLHYCTDIMSKHKGKQPMHGPTEEMFPVISWCLLMLKFTLNLICSLEDLYWSWIKTVIIPVSCFHQYQCITVFLLRVSYQMCNNQNSNITSYHIHNPLVAIYILMLTIPISEEADLHVLFVRMF